MACQCEAQYLESQHCGRRRISRSMSIGKRSATFARNRCLCQVNISDLFPGMGVERSQSAPPGFPWALALASRNSNRMRCQRDVGMNFSDSPATLLDTERGIGPRRRCRSYEHIRRLDCHC